MQDTPLDRCITCVLPRSAQQISFDNDGMCMLCKTAENPSTRPQDGELVEREVESIIDGIRRRGKGHPYDCVVGVSGGRDSSYLLYLLVKKHQIRCLAAYYRTPFTVDMIDANVRRMTTRLDVPLVEMDISPEHHRRVARDLVLLWRKNRQSVLPNLACAPCKEVNRQLFRVAAAQRIPTIVAGCNVFEAVQISAGQPGNTTIIPGHEAAKQLSLRTHVTKMLFVIKRGIGVLRRSTSLWRYIPLGVKASVMYISLHTPFLRLRYPGIQVVEYFYHTRWDEEACKDALQEIGWELPPGFNSTWKADCTFAELKNHMFYQMMGITYLDAFLSNMIRGGVLSRDEALRRLATEGETSKVRLADACRVLELPEDLCA